MKRALAINQIDKRAEGRNLVSRRGFTIVEIITVLFIVSVGLVGVLSLIIKNIQSQNYNKNSLIAYQLAQEGIELVREVRDTNWKLLQSFNYNLADGTYYLDYLDIVPVASAAPEPLYLSGTGYYSHDPSGTASGFNRLVTIETIDASSIRVTSSVSWQIRNQDFNYDLETILYDWK